MGVRPFPWSAIERVSRADVDAASAIFAWGRARFDVGALVPALGEACGVPVEIRLRTAGAAGARTLEPGAIGVLLGDAVDAAPHRAVLVEAEPALAVAAAAAALQRSAPRAVDPARANTPALAGAAGALLVAVARRATDRPLRALGCGSAATLWAEANRLDPDRIAATFTVLFGDDAFVARVSIGRTRPSVARSFDLAGLERLGRTPLELPLVAACALADRSEIDGLRAGDAWMPGTPIGLVGEVTLCAPDAEIGARARLGEDGRLVLLDGSASLSWTAPPKDAKDMPLSDETKDALTGTLGESPVVVRVEIGCAKLAAREWAALGVGDVVALGRRVGEPVVLRVGGEELARGELVEVDGEVGVRLVWRAGQRP